MSNEQFRHYIETIRRLLAVLQGEQVAEVWEESAAALEGLQMIYEEMQTSLEVAEVVEEELLQLNQRATVGYHHYYDLFHSSPIAYLVTDERGVILEANQASAQLLNVPQPYLAGKPLVVYVAEGDRPAFCTNLNRLSQNSGIQVWQMNLCPRDGKPFTAQWHVAIARDTDGLIESLRIGVYNLSVSQPAVPSQLRSRSAHLALAQTLEEMGAHRRMPMSQLPQSLDGLRVLVVDDEADAREFIAAVLESYGVSVRAVASAAAALEELERFHPDMLLSDIRMPGGDGYSLIRQIRALEALQGGHIPAAAITAYLDEDRENSLKAGFEAYLHKLAQPSEWIEMVAQLAKYTFP